MLLATEIVRRPSGKKDHAMLVPDAGDLARETGSRRETVNGTGPRATETAHDRHATAIARRKETAHEASGICIVRFKN